MQTQEQNTPATLTDSDRLVADALVLETQIRESGEYTIQKIAEWNVKVQVLLSRANTLLLPLAQNKDALLYDPVAAFRDGIRDALVSLNIIAIEGADEQYGLPCTVPDLQKRTPVQSAYTALALLRESHVKAMSMASAQKFTLIIDTACAEIERRRRR